jgi:ATP-dependent helicase/DNAse subunit B
MEQSFPPGTAIDTEGPLIVSISDDREIRVCGRLDRIDRIGDPVSDQYAVCDYKSGSAWKYETADPFNGGRVVQHALYLAMAQARLKEAVAKGAAADRFVYFFPGQRDHGLRMEFSSAALSEWPRVVAALCDISASGSFLATNDADTDCRFCDYRTVCGDVQEVAAASKVKLENMANTVLKPMRELRRRVQQ